MKASGNALGKGVIVAGDVGEAEDAIDFAVDMERDAAGFLADINIGGHADGRFAEGVEKALDRLMSTSLVSAA